MSGRSDRSYDTTLAYVGSAVQAAGYRLGGFVAITPEHGNEAAAIEALRAAAHLIVLEASVAARLPRARLEHWLAAGAPLIVIAPDNDGAPSPLDPAARVRIQLGLDA